MAEESLEEVPPVKLTLVEQLTLSFYNWEKRGRGWQVWEYPVELEPAFEPFYFHLPPASVAVDDGRHPTFLSEVWEGIKGIFENQRDSNEEESVGEGKGFQLPPAPFENTESLHEITLSLPLKQKFDIEIAENFLLNLSYSYCPFSFEIIGSKDSVFVQFSCRDPDLYRLKQQLKAYFPDAVLYDESNVLSSRWNKEIPSFIVDFGLSQEFMRPLRTFRKLEPDPLTGIFGVLDDLEKGELAVFQVLFQAATHPWSENIIRAVTDDQGNSFFADSRDMVLLSREKIQRPLYAAVIRAAAQSSDGRARASEIIETIASSLRQVANPPSNELLPLNNEDYEDDFHIDDMLLRQTHRSAMLLNSAELVSLVHPPSISIRSAKLRRELKKSKAAPAMASGHQLILGENRHQGQIAQVSLSPEHRFRHMHLIGATGTGKSTLLLNLIVQDIRNGQGLAILDPHGDLIERVLGHIPEERFEDVILLDPSDSEFPVGLNILSAYSEIDKTVLASDLVSVFRRLSTSWGDQMNSIFSNAVLAFLESEKGGTLHDLRRFLVEKSFRESFLQTVKDKEVIYYWQKEFPILVGKAQAPILTRLDTFLRPKPIRNMVVQKEGLNFREILDSRKILFAKLAQGLIGVENAYLLGTIIVSKLHQAAMARQSKSESERKDFFLYVDEFQNFATKSMAEILSGGRKYHFGLVLAHQDLRQLLSRDDELASSVIANPGTRICFRLGDFDAKKLEEGFAYFDAQDLQNLGIGEAIARIERADQDFNLKTTSPADVPEDIVRERRERVIELSRKKYACPLEKLESQLAVQKEFVERQDFTAAVPSAVEQGETDSRQPDTIEKPARKPAPEKAELLPEEKSFLEFLNQHPDMFITKVYKALQLSGYKGDKLKSDLIEQGLIVQEETRRGLLGRLAKVLRLTDKGVSVVEKLASAGKGGDLHKDLQNMVKEQAELFGWKARVEERIPRTLENVDVGLDKDGIRVAVEISSTTTPEHEVQNIRKCLEAGYDYILAVCSDDKRLSQLKTEVKKAFSFKERERIRFYHSSRVKEFFGSVGAEVIVSEKGIVSDHIRKQKQLLDSTEAAEFLGISKNTLYEWTSQKKISYVKVGGLLKFKTTDLERWLDRRTQEEERFDMFE
ncbi:MAG: type IV secretion system DNA-binding domain-containing protein [Candidatus Glassbacteria bacterium]